jgi:peptidoglycan/LPS O-acetylase OafA/YrhL
MASTELAAVRHIPSLDGMRACAALLVFVYHTDLFPGYVSGSLGVTIFFFLSGFLITTLLRVEYESTGTISLRDFYLRRAYRILPPMYLVLILVCIPPIGRLGPETTPGAVLAEIANLTNYYVIFGGDHLIPDTGPMWSLAVEQHFYMVFPLLLLALLRRFSRARVAGILALCCLVVLLWRCFLTFDLSPPQNYIPFATDTRIDSILFGAVMALAFNPVLDGKRVNLRPWAWQTLLALGVALIVASEACMAPPFRNTLRYTLEGLCLLPCFYCAVRFSDWPIFRWLEWPWVRGLGLVSYTFYLCSFKAEAIASRLNGAPAPLRAAVGLCLAIAFSAVVFFMVEKPFARLRRRLHSTPTTAPMGGAKTIPAKSITAV